MSGYFQRLLARSAQSRAAIHPLARLPQAAWFDNSQPAPEWQGSNAEVAARPERFDAEPVRQATLFDQPQFAAASERLEPTINVETTAQPRAATPQADFSPYAMQERDALVMKIAQPIPARQNAAQTDLPAGAPMLYPDAFSDAHTAFRLMPNPAQLNPHQLNQNQPNQNQPNQNQMAAPVAAPLDVAQLRLQAAQLAIPADRNAQQDKTTVHVSIGRIEVTAVPAPEPAKHSARVGGKAMSLDEYLNKRQQERA